MSYRPSYPESWRPPPQCDSWRPSTQPPNCEADRPWSNTRKRYGGEDPPLMVRHLPFTRGDSWRPYTQERHTLPKREEGHDHGGKNAAARTTSYRSLGSPRQTFSLPTRQAISASGRPQSYLDPSVTDFQPGDIRPNSNFNHAAPAPLRSVQNLARYSPYRVNKPYRSAEPSSNPTSRVGEDNLDILKQNTSPSHRYALRSRRSDEAPLTALDDVRIPSDQFHQIISQNGRGPTRSSAILAQHAKHRQTKPQQIHPPPAPTATDLYLAQARLPVIRCAAPKKLLVVLDLNGTLLVRPNRMKSREFNIRPGVHQFLDYLFDHHLVMIYSSARPENVEAMVDALVSKKRAKALAAIWGRDKLGLTPEQYNEKVQVYKKLDKVWEDDRIQATCPGKQPWNQTNTVLVDDSHLKALSHPHNLIQVTEFTKKKLDPQERKREQEVVASVRAKLEELKWTLDVSRHILRWQTGQMEPPLATKLSPLPKSGEEGMRTQPSQSANIVGDSGEIPDEAIVQEGLEKDMENLTTNTSSKDDNGHMNEPAISANEWKEFLK
ncbi:hypothetical protein EPUS_01168 [Endocarpon pusillum Z07020]|uniref:Mitochondrial import inner membrane translocase subunit TIM50 n=1 Tax=Endocarpon pusillum (strain Z07020 / HMAS-L-300199) TaxID=1263415 RepID=U1GC04_ENDPU|nr:uncharacterized protein EPUS_01168 [Endocarpon pusillum Z07020]ERF69211.1 hypothetical protein EPUS_01168 [Endocarpon pusillum Z07020]